METTSNIKKMTVEEIRAYIRDNLQKVGKKPETIITFTHEGDPAYADGDGDPVRGYLSGYGMSSRIQKRKVEWAGNEKVFIIIETDDYVTPKTKKPIPQTIDVELESIATIADA